MSAQAIEKIIADRGFDCTGKGVAADLEVREEVRAMCAADRCNMYNASWSCPPACGDIEDFGKEMHAYTTFMVVQTVAQLEDEFDVEGMMEAEATQKDRIYGLIEDFSDAGLSAEVMVLSSGTCRLCAKCTYPDNPCRFPDKRLVSMEAAGLVVSDACGMAGIPYNHGQNTLTYSGCVLYNEEG